MILMPLNGYLRIQLVIVYSKLAGSATLLALPSLHSVYYFNVQMLLSQYITSDDLWYASIIESNHYFR